MNVVQTDFEGIYVVLGAPDNAVVMTIGDAFKRPENGTSRPPSERHDQGFAQAGPSKMHDQVRLIIAGRLNPSKGILLDEIAKVFEESSRTVKRWLASEGTNFNRIVDEVRMSDAKRLLIETEIPISEISVALGYKHLPSFSRAFKRSTGKSPSQVHFTSVFHRAG